MSKKAELRKIYDEWQGENKVGFRTFYQKTCQHPELPLEERITPQEQRAYKYTQYVYKGKHKELWERYQAQPNKEVSFYNFVSRVRDGHYPKEIAITNGAEWERAKKEKTERGQTYKYYGRTSEKYVEEKPLEIDDYFFIKVKYPREVALVFMREYESLLEDMEYQLMDIHDKESRNKIEQKMAKVHLELSVFKCYNDM